MRLGFKSESYAPIQHFQGYQGVDFDVGKGATLSGYDYRASEEKNESFNLLATIRRRSHQLHSTQSIIIKGSP